MVKGIEDLFPKLRGTGYQIHGPPDPTYNCVAWAAGATDSWWWPVGDAPRVYWPPGVPREETVDAVRAAFAALGYVVCDRADSEPGHEKVALFADAAGFQRTRLVSWRAAAGPASWVSSNALSTRCTTWKGRHTGRSRW